MRFETSMITRHKQIKNRRGNGLGASESQLFRLSATMVELSLGHNRLDSPTDITPTLPIKPQCNPAEAKVQFSASVAATAKQHESKAAQPHHRRLQASRELLRRCVSRISGYGIKINSWLEPRTKVQFSASIAATAEQQENQTVQPHHSGLQASRELLRRCVSRISGYGIKIYSWLERRTKVQFSASIAATAEQRENQAAQPQHRGLQANREPLRICISRISDYGVEIYSSLKSRMRMLAAGSAAILLTLLAFSVVYAVRRHHRDSVKSQSQTPAAVQQHDLAPVSSSASEPTHDDAHTVTPNKAKSRRRQGDYIAKDTYVYYGKDGKPSH
jgi:hypothetical protein